MVSLKKEKKNLRIHFEKYQKNIREPATKSDVESIVVCDSYREQIGRLKNCLNFFKLNKLDFSSFILRCYLVSIFISVKFKIYMKKHHVRFE